MKNLADLLAEGEEIDSFAMKDLEHFEMLFSYTNFPELLNSLKG